tara:strand:+ start:1574 stop:1852 length:279 start_codon:yes stop_codon:yes gene_type:complete
MNITPEIVRNLLDTLVTPQFDDIVDYNIILRQSWPTALGSRVQGNTGVGIDVITKQMMSDISHYKIERNIRDVMKYLSPSFTMVEFYTSDNY